MDMIVVITENYPFGKGEEFFQTEIQYLAKNFSCVHVCSLSTDTLRTKEIPSTVQVSRIDTTLNIIQRLLCVRYIFTKEFLGELYALRVVFKKHITWLCLKLILWNMIKGHMIVKKVRGLLKDTPEHIRIILYSYWMHHGAYAIAKLRKEGIGNRAICRAHGFDLYFERNEANYIPFRTFIGRYLDGIHPISLNGKNYLDQILPASKDKIVVSRLGVLQKPYCTLPERKDQDVFQLLSISNLIPVKRVHLIVQTLAYITESKIHWTHIGDGPLREDLVRQAKETFSDKNNITFDFVGYIAHDDVLNYYCNNHVDMLINVSESEGIPVTMMEAQSFGIPILALDVGGVSEIVNAENGILLSKDISPNIIASQIETFIHLPAKEKTRYHEAALFSWKHMYDAETNYMEFITKILCGK